MVLGIMRSILMCTSQKFLAWLNFWELMRVWERSDSLGIVGIDEVV